MTNDYQDDKHPTIPITHVQQNLQVDNHEQRYHYQDISLNIEKTPGVSFKKVLMDITIDGIINQSVNWLKGFNNSQMK